MDTLEVFPGQLELAWLRAGGDQQPVVGESPVEEDVRLRRFDRRGMDASQELCPEA